MSAARHPEESPTPPLVSLPPPRPSRNAHNNTFLHQNNNNRTDSATKLAAPVLIALSQPQPILARPLPMPRYYPDCNQHHEEYAQDGVATSPPKRPDAPMPIHTMLSNTTNAPNPVISEYYFDEALNNSRKVARIVHPLPAERRMAFFRLMDFEVVRPLGTGTFGRVYLMNHKGANKLFALKKIRKIDVIRLQQVEHVQNERSLLCRLNHPFIVRMYSAMQDSRHLFMLMEYASGGELFLYLRKAGRFTLDASRFYIAELVVALEYLHSFDIAYRDLKPENLLLDSEGHVKLADFGFAKLVPNCTYTLCGTPEYLAPEIIRGNGYGKSVDWWALGILLHEMLLGYPPFYGETPTAVYEKILKGRINLPLNLNKDATDFLSRLLTVDFTKRLGCSERGAVEVKEMPFFQGVNWDRVYQRVYHPPIVPPSSGDAKLAVNFPKDNSQSSMDVEIPHESTVLAAHSLQFPGFHPA